MVALLCSVAESAHDFEVGGYNVTSETNSGVEVIEGTNGYSGYVVIPSSVSYNGKITALQVLETKRSRVAAYSDE